jgi:hypothetical protein
MIVDPFITNVPAIAVRRPTAEWPSPLERSLDGLPKRWVFRNDRVSVLLAGLKRSEAVVLGPWPQACLLVVAFGRLNFVTGGHRLCLLESDSVVILPAVRQELQALDAVDFLLLNLTLPSTFPDRCFCHSTAGREEALAAAARLFGSDARL